MRELWAVKELTIEKMLSRLEELQRAFMLGGQAEGRQDWAVDAFRLNELNVAIRKASAQGITKKALMQKVRKKVLDIETSFI